MLLANRNDGFGQRLKALLQAIRLSDLAGLQYKFIWNEKSGPYGAFHSCPSVNEVFDYEYINKHFTSSETPSSPLRLNDHSDITSLNEREIYSVDGRSEFLNNLNPSYQTEFEKIVFSEKVALAVKLASSVVLDDNTIAIHLRAGDICYGPLKKKSIIYQSKVIPISLAKKIIKGLNGTALIFSQDKELKEYLIDYDNIIFSDDLMADVCTDNIQRVMFDIVLMSRCHQIVGGDSAVPLVASMLSGVNVLDPLEHFGSKVIINSIVEDDGFTEDQYDNDLLYFTSINLLYHLIITNYDEVKEASVAKKIININKKNPQSIFISYLYNVEGPPFETKNHLDDVVIQSCLDVAKEFFKSLHFKNFVLKEKISLNDFENWLKC